MEGSAAFVQAQRYVLGEHSSAVTCVCFSPSDQFIASARYLVIVLKSQSAMSQSSHKSLPTHVAAFVTGLLSDV